MTAKPNVAPLNGLVSVEDQAVADGITAQGVHNRLNRLGVPTLLWSGRRWFFRRDYEAAILARMRPVRRQPRAA